MNERLKTFKGLKEGAAFKVVANTNGHNYPMNVRLHLNTPGFGTTMTNCAREVPSGDTLSCRDCVLEPSSLEYMEKQIKTLQEEIKTLETQIEFCKTLGTTEYDETEFKVYQTLALMEDKQLTKAQKVKLISKIIE